MLHQHRPMRGIPTETIHGNTLSMKFSASWKNIHWITRGYMHLLVSRPNDGNTANSPPNSPEPTQIPQSFLGTVAIEQGRPPLRETIKKSKLTANSSFLILHNTASYRD